MTPRRVLLLLAVPVVALLVLGPALDWTPPTVLTSAADRSSAAAAGLPPGEPLVDAEFGEAVPGVTPAAGPADIGSSGDPSAGPGGAGRPGAGQPGADQRGAASPGAGQPGTGQPGAGLPGAGLPAAGANPGVTAATAGRPGCVNSVAAAFTPGGATAAGATPVAMRRGAGRRVPVANATALTAALTAARPGDTIELADGRYPGKFVISRAGTAAAPITLVGTCRAVLDGGAGSGYAMHLNGADQWRLVGFTVTGAEKGIMTDRTNRTVLSHLTVGNTGAEAVHFGNFSSDNTVQYSVIQNTGKKKPQFGEGLYFGTAKSNWGSKSGGSPDASNNNRALNNAFRSTTAENIDVKEATSGGIIAGNSFDGSGISGDNFADSVLDMKGVRYRVLNNRTSGASSKLKSGFQTHVITDPASSGCGNTFTGNTFPGLSFGGGQAIELDKKCG